ncbi:hypothetical protein [Albimonas pacifica]|uniref:Trypsin-like peptidase domain-containing protein n=1 Tax=Albimonas pacifica TaxID=1114924 RepID=A0A1I3BF39_9RHOB|nr:hypothetical protein [Albimonas pacifica]SFH60341.1 hypothetical protein SAMN05216258_10112 [Albimonas pacifica]
MTRFSLRAALVPALALALWPPAPAGAQGEEPPYRTPRLEDRLLPQPTPDQRLPLPPQGTTGVPGPGVPPERFLDDPKLWMPWPPDQPLCCATGRPCCGTLEPLGFDLSPDGGASAAPPPSLVQLLAPDRPPAAEAGCSNPLGLPSAVMETLCDPALLEETRPCSDAVRALLAMRFRDDPAETGADAYLIGALELMARDIPPADRVAFLIAYEAALGAYLDLCLTPLERLATAAPAAAAEAIARRTGVFTDDARPNWRCGGVVVGGHVATALHCLRAPGRPTELLPLDGLAFRSSEGIPVRGFAPEAAVWTVADPPAMLRSGGHGDADDIVALPLPADARTGWGPELEIAAADPGAALISAGPNLNARERASIRAMLAMPAPGTGGLFFADVGVMCRAMATSAEGCVLHACQTEHQMSGSPLFTTGPDGAARLAAIQVARIDPGMSETCLRLARGPATPNLAASAARLRFPDGR